MLYQLPLGSFRKLPVFAGLFAVSISSSILLAQKPLPGSMEEGLAMRQNGRSFHLRHMTGSAAAASNNVTAQSAVALPAQIKETVLHAFEPFAPQGFEPESGVVADSEGNFYGSTYNYGPSGARGVIYKMDRSGNVSVFHAFTGGTDGANPTGDLIIDGAGNLYGTTVWGGNLNACAGQYLGCGVVFKLDKAGHETVLYSFKGGSNGQNPYIGKLTMDSAGNLYGITSFGGNMSACSGQGCGVVFKLDKSGTETNLYTFNGASDGAQPNGGLLLDNAGNLYGTTRFGGNAGNLGACNGQLPGCGVVFKLDQSGNETVLFAFQGSTDGAIPRFGLTVDKAGNFYGTAAHGGNVGLCGGEGCGVIFKLDQAGHETPLYTFNGTSDGAFPDGGVIIDKVGNLYGSADAGGDLTLCPDGSDNGCGVVFKLDKNGNETVLHTFTGGNDGANPSSSLALDSAGDLHGTTTVGGLAGFGSVFKLAADGNKTEFLSYGLPSPVRGSQPFGNLVLDGNGNRYGVAGGGTYAAGVLFKLDQSGHETVLHIFTGGNDGGYPNANLTIDNAGNLYGTAQSGGSSGSGIVFKIDKSGNETVLYNFQGAADGGTPLAGVIFDNAGNLYGTTIFGGNLSACFGSGCGVVFKLDKSGNETVLHAFSGGTDGGYPLYASVILDSAGNLYGTTLSGGNANVCPNAFPTPGCGVVFKLDKSGNETVLHTFSGAADGATPQAPLVLDNAGNLYGTTFAGGNANVCTANYFTAGCGVVFKLDQSGNETVLHTFTGGADGATPEAGLIFDNTGNLYGAAYAGGNVSACPATYQDGYVIPGCGVLFKLDKAGNQTALYTFSGADGSGPQGSLVFDNAGNLYGTTTNGGPYSGGVVFELLHH